MAGSIEGLIPKHLRVSSRAFSRDEAGAATIEFVSLSASLLFAAMLALHPVATSVQEIVPGIQNIISSRLGAAGTADRPGIGQFSEGAQESTRSAAEAGRGSSGHRARNGAARGHGNSFGWGTSGGMNSWR